jgi:aspartyl-tRNA(Asn)/glutamyl-tRNA(Gln) amidotransferase subunit A
MRVAAPAAAVSLWRAEMTELAFQSIAELSRLIAARDLSPVELVQALLDRVAAHDGKVASFLLVTDKVALAQAKAAEAQIMAGGARGKLHGIPFGLKDIVETAGIRTTAHSKLLQDHVPRDDATLVTKLYEAGGVLLGKLATFEFALGGPSFDLPWPPARNPWNTDYLPGGSSSGSGAAVAAGFVPCAIGTDTGGSVRWPAAVCGIVGLKPTYGRVSRRGVFPNTFTIDHCGPMTRTVEDCAIMLQAIAGFDPLDPGSADQPVPDYVVQLSTDIRGMRIGWVSHWYSGGNAHPDVPPAIAAAAKVLEDLGAIIEPVELPPLRDYADCKTTISIAELYAIHEADLKKRPQDFGRLLRNRVLPGALIRAEDYVQAMRRRTELAHQLGLVLKRYDALLTAGWLTVADKADPDAPDTLTRTPNVTMPFSVGGLPAVSVPCGFSREGLPLAIQLAARPFAEGTVLKVAHAYEQATLWHKQHPKLH